MRQPSDPIGSHMHDLKHRTGDGLQRGHSHILMKFPWTSVQGTIHTRTLKNKLPFPVHVAGVLDQNRPGRAFLRPTLSGDVPSLSLDYGKKRIGPPDHRTRLLEVATSSSSVRSAGADRG